MRGNVWRLTIQPSSHIGLVLSTNLTGTIYESNRNLTGNLTGISPTSSQSHKSHSESHKESHNSSPESHNFWGPKTLKITLVSTLQIACHRETPRSSPGETQSKIMLRLVAKVWLVVKGLYQVAKGIWLVAKG